MDSIRKLSLYKMSYIREPYTGSKSKIKVELDLSNYATKSDVKNTMGLDTSKFAKKANLASLKSEIDKLDVDQLGTTPVNLTSNKNEVVQKTVYDELVKQINYIDTSGLI